MDDAAIACPHPCARDARTISMAFSCPTVSTLVHLPASTPAFPSPPVTSHARMRLRSAAHCRDGAARMHAHACAPDARARSAVPARREALPLEAAPSSGAPPHMARSLANPPFQRSGALCRSCWFTQNCGRPPPRSRGNSGVAANAGWRSAALHGNTSCSDTQRSNDRARIPCLSALLHSHSRARELEN